MGHFKHDNALDQCWLIGPMGDALHAVLCASGSNNIRWLLRAFVRPCLEGLLALVLVVLEQPVERTL